MKGQSNFYFSTFHHLQRMTYLPTEAIVKQVIVDQKKSVEALLTELGLSKSLVVLVDGARAQLDDLIEEGQEIIILPPLAGGV